MERKEAGINTKLKNLTLKVLAGVISMSPMVGRANENISGKILNNNSSPVDTTKGIETSNTLSKEEQQLIDRRFKNFLDGEGGYSDEELDRRMFYSYLRYKADLGFCELTDDTMKVQGVLLGHFENKGNDFVAIGIKDRDNKRKISLLEWFINERIEAFSCDAVIEIEMVRGASSSRFWVQKLASREEAVNFVNDKMGDVLLFDFFTKSDKDINTGDFKALDKKKQNFYLDYVIPRSGASVGFVSGVLMPSAEEMKSMNRDNVAFIKSLDKNIEIPGVLDCSDVLSSLNNDSVELPVLSTIWYNKILH